MNKKELIKAITVHEKTDVNKQQAETMLNVLINIIKDVLLNDDNLALKGFGTFTVHHLAERKGHNPRTGDVITIAACRKPVFKASNELKKRLNS